MSSSASNVNLSSIITTNTGGDQAQLATTMSTPITGTTAPSMISSQLSSLKSTYDIDVIRLIGQHLNDLGMRQTVTALLEESGLQGLDHPLATRFQQHILDGDWDKASSLVEELANLIASTSTGENESISQMQTFPLTSQNHNQISNQTAPTNASSASCYHGGSNNNNQNNNTEHINKKQKNVDEMRMAIAEQKFLELIEDNQHIQALKCLRLEVTPLTDDIKHVQHLATLLMCKSTDELRLRANWPGKGQQSRQMLVEKIHRFIPPFILLPPRRLSTLLNQAMQLQRERCSLHISRDEEDDELMVTSIDRGIVLPSNGVHSKILDDVLSNNSSSIMMNTNNATTNNNITTNNGNNMQQTSNGHSTIAATSSSISISTSTSASMFNSTRNFDLKQDHLCTADKFPLYSRQELDNHKSEVWFCKFSNDGTKLATGGLGGKIKIWHVDPVERNLVEKFTLDRNIYSITCLSWSPNDVYLLACGSDDRPDLWIWNIEKEELHNMISLSDDESTTTCSWHMSGDKFAAASIKGNFNIYDLDGNRRGTREGVRVQCLSFLHKDPDYILAADTLNRIKSYAIRDMSLESDEEDILEERHSIMSFTIDKDDKYIAVNLMEQGVHLWDFRLKTLLRMFPGVRQRHLTIYSSFSSPNSTFLASGSEDGKVYIYHVHKDQPVAILHGHSRCVNCVTWNPKYPELLVSVSDDRIVRLWAPLGRASQIKTSSDTYRMC